MKGLLKQTEKLKNSVQNWASAHNMGMFIFVLVLMLLILLYTAGYFHPFFKLTVNSIFFIGMVLAVFLLNANSTSLFVIGLIFWLLAGFFSVFQIDVWAERTTVYMFQALFIGVILSFVESVKENT